MEETQTDTNAAPLVSFKKRTAKSKSNLRKKAPSPPPASDSEESEYSSSDNEGGRQIKRRRKNAAVTASSSKPAHTGVATEENPTSTSTPFPITSSNDATKQSNWYDEGKEDDLSAKNLLGATMDNKQSTSATADKTPTLSDGTYRGQSNYQSFIQKNPNAPTKQVGPMKAPTNIRTITVTDYAPDVCKDYKLTGFCGFGDTCKFLHSRDSVKQGWELDRDWEISTKGKKLAGRTVASANRNANAGENADDDDDDDALLESIPFACILCKKSYKNPIVTKCGHYFCESCALQRYRKNPSCAACGSGTGGVFNVAKRLTKLLEKKRERVKKRKEKAREEGEEVSDSDEEDEPESESE